MQVLDAIERAEQRTERSEIGAHIGEVRQPHREKISLRVERQFPDHFVGRAMTVRDKAIGALVGPLHRPPERAGGMKKTDIFRKHRCLHAERTADLAGQHVDVLGLDAKRLGKMGAHSEDALRRDIKCKAAAIV